MTLIVNFEPPSSGCVPSPTQWWLRLGIVSGTLYFGIVWFSFNSLKSFNSKESPGIQYKGGGIQAWCGGSTAHLCVHCRETKPVQSTLHPHEPFRGGFVCRRWSCLCPLWPLAKLWCVIKGHHTRSLLVLENALVLGKYN